MWFVKISMENYTAEIIALMRKKVYRKIMFKYLVI